MSGPAPRFGAQEGLSLVEVMIGMAVSIVIASAMALGLISNSNSALGTQRQAQLLAIVQDRIEWVHQLLRESYASKGFSAVALSSNPEKGKDYPSVPTDPTDPNDFIVNWNSSASSEGFLIEKNYNGTAEGYVGKSTSEGETLEVDGTNGKVPAVSYVDLTTGASYSSASSVPSPDSYAIVNTYVTVANEVVSSAVSSCPTGASGGSTTTDARRVIVAARLVPAGSSNADVATPQYATTLLANPTPSNTCQSATGLRAEFGVGE
jgi:Tfp pilus assembly protein PilW